MIDYVVWCPARCGSILTSRILLTAIYGHQQELLHYNQDNTSYLGPAKIVHSHSPEFLIQSEPAMEKIVLTRNIFDSALSQAIMSETKIGHLSGIQQVLEYKTRFQDTQFVIDPVIFSRIVRKIDYKFTVVLQSNAQYTCVSYEQIKDNPFNVLKLLKINKKDINYKLLTTNPPSDKIPLEKFQMVANYQDLKTMYNELYIKNKSLT